MINSKIWKLDINEIKSLYKNKFEDYKILEKIKLLNTNRIKILNNKNILGERRNHLSEQYKKILSENNEAKLKEIKKEIEIVKKDIILNENDQKYVIKEFNQLSLYLPNIPDKSVPEGESDQDNIEVRRWGKCKEKDLDWKVISHEKTKIFKKLVNPEKGAEVSGSKFLYYTGNGARLVRALVSFMLDVHYKNKYLEIKSPLLVKPEIMFGSGHLPKFRFDTYYVSKDDLYLIPTSEVTLTNYYKNEIIKNSKLPIKLVSFSNCFRQEAGAAGKKNKGLFRLHQFNKVELVYISSPKDSFKDLEKIVNDAEKILQLLDLPYRVLELCTGDLGFSAAKTYDLEVWMRASNDFLEISSCTNCTDFQARRINIKYKNNNKNELVHTLNGSALAVDRLIACILERYQEKDGRVRIPKVLRPYMCNEEFL